MEIPISLVMNVKVDPDWKHRSESSDNNKVKQEETGDDNGVEKENNKDVHPNKNGQVVEGSINRTNDHADDAAEKFHHG